MELEGKLINLLEVTSGRSVKGEWKKQSFIIETQEEYPKKVCVTAWGQKVDNLSQFAIGDILSMSVDVESREFNGKWYTDVKVFKLDRVSQATSAPIVANNTTTEDDFSSIYSSEEDFVF